MGSGAMIYIPNFINIGSGSQQLIGRIHIQTHSKNNTRFVKWINNNHCFYKLTFIFQNKESMLKMKIKRKIKLSLRVSRLLHYEGRRGFCM
jgi:hypothetical protein